MSDYTLYMYKGVTHTYIHVHVHVQAYNGEVIGRYHGDPEKWG